MVVADIQLISEKDSIPHGYCYIAEHLDQSEYMCTGKLIFDADLMCIIQFLKHFTCVCVQRPLFQRRNVCACASSLWAVWKQLC